MQNFTKQALIKVYRKQSIQKGHPLTTVEIKKDTKLPSLNTIYKFFNSVQHLRQIAGLVPVKICYDTKNNMYIFKRKDAMEQAKEEFCKICVESPKNCKKNVEGCLKEMEGVIDYE